MPGMLDDFDAHTARQVSHGEALDEQERAYRERTARDAAIAFERLKAMLRGERPTRESNEEWMLRRSRGMLPADPPAAKRPFSPNAPYIPSFVRG